MQARIYKPQRSSLHMCLVTGLLSAEHSGSRHLTTLSHLLCPSPMSCPVDRAEVSEQEALPAWEPWVSWAVARSSWVKYTQNRNLTGLSLPWRIVHLQFSTVAMFSTVALALHVPNEVISRFEIYQPSVPGICSSSSGKELSVQSYGGM